MQYFLQVIPAFITLNSKRFNDCIWLRRSAAIITILLIGFANASDMVYFQSIFSLYSNHLHVLFLIQFAASIKSSMNENDTLLHVHSNNSFRLNDNSDKSLYNGTSTPSSLSYLQPPSVICIFPSYFSHYAVLILIATTILTQLSHIYKVVLMIVITGN